MAFKPGQSGNPTGRPKGSNNKTSDKLRTLISNFLEEKFPEIQREFERLEPKDKVKVYTDLLNYGLPKLQAVSTSLNYDDLTDEQLDQIINRLTEKYND